MIKTYGHLNRKCLIHVLYASKNDAVNKFLTNSWKVGTSFNFAVNVAYMTMLGYWSTNSRENLMLKIVHEL